MPDLAELFSFSLSPWEIVLRGSAVYWFLFALFRFVLRRDVGSIAITDMLLLVLIADASQNAMAGGYKTISDGFVLVATIAGWNYILDWAAFRFASLQKLLEGHPIELVRNGRILQRNMRRELVTRSELQAALRSHGIDDLTQVKQATMETNGEISVVEQDKASSSAGASHKKPIP